MNERELVKFEKTVVEALEQIDKLTEAVRAAYIQITGRPEAPAKSVSVFDLSHEEILRQIQTYKYDDYDRNQYATKYGGKYNRSSQKAYDAGFLIYLKNIRTIWKTDKPDG